MAYASARTKGNAVDEGDSMTKREIFENCANSLAYVPLLKYNKSTKKWDIVTFRREYTRSAGIR